MPSPRKLYRQKSSIVLSFPFYLCRDIGAEPADFFLQRPVSATTLLFDLNKRFDVEAKGIDFYRNIPFSSLRKLYRQSNCLVCSVARPILEYVNATAGDTIELTWIGQTTLSGSVVKAEVRAYQEARQFNKFRQHRLHKQPPPNLPLEPA